VRLSRYCHEQIGSAERRIEQLTERGDVRDASHLADTDGNDR
jgi:exonuclease VII small subunit